MTYESSWWLWKVRELLLWSDRFRVNRLYSPRVEITNTGDCRKIWAMDFCRSQQVCPWSNNGSRMIRLCRGLRTAPMPSTGYQTLAHLVRSSFSIASTIAKVCIPMQFRRKSQLSLRTIRRAARKPAKSCYQIPPWPHQATTSKTIAPVSVGGAKRGESTRSSSQRRALAWKSDNSWTGTQLSSSTMMSLMATKSSATAVKFRRRSRWKISWMHSSRASQKPLECPKSMAKSIHPVSKQGK